MVKRRRGIGVVLAAVLATAAASARADAPVLELPVACDMTADCSIQKYMDHDRGPDRLDYTCGRLSKDGDAGIDFRVRDYPAMQRGVSVLAAAPGIVKAYATACPTSTCGRPGPRQFAVARRATGW